MADEKMVYFLVAIVAIVAIVGMVTMFLMSAGTYTAIPYSITSPGYETGPSEMIDITNMSGEDVESLVGAARYLCNALCARYCAESAGRADERWEDYWVYRMRANNCISIDHGCDCDGAVGRMT